ncbi:ABC transporter permease [Piscinibacter sakaiensis]|uniref:Dipeptide transport system permease protein DppB n=1 Tax=Piscinibacter sakaiensis TaxID=1547922 RepID=A0A0K8P6R0_PISS1|nr:ABC transporter permease [Piscinibacter sakaiensis]GAP38204.1 dipeptide transport system permease protein DppB [Piscinibacter sakaiensis]
MLTQITRRLLAGCLTLLLVGVAAFGIFQHLGDPVISMAGLEATEAERQAFRQELGLDDSQWVQLGRFLKNVARGEFGLSYHSGRSVSRLIAERLPATLDLVLVASVLSLVLGIALGVYTGLRPDTPVTRGVLSLSLVGISLPTFVTGTLLIYVFTMQLNLLPSFGRGELVAFGEWTTGLLTRSGLLSLVMPSITLALFQMTLIQRLTRAEMMEVARADFIRFGRARGLPYRRVYLRHALRNALLPVITIAGLNIGAVIGFSIITETIFQWPGMGLLFIEAVRFSDVPVLAAYLLLIALIFTVINIGIDILYVIIDPRLRAPEGTP